MPRSAKLPVRLQRPPTEASSDEWRVFVEDLVRRGDPRGELIAVGRELEGTIDPELRVQLELRRKALRAALEREYVSGGVALVRSDWSRGHIVGLTLTLTLTDPTITGAELRRTLDSPTTLGLQRLSVEAPPALLHPIVEALAASPRWLELLELRLLSRGEPTPALVSETVALRLCQALPRLRTLRLSGRQLFEDFPHPTLESLEMRGYDAIEGVGQWTDLPRLHTFKLSIQSGSEDERAEPREPVAKRRLELLSGDGMPALRVLDLSGNGRGAHAGTLFLGGIFPERLIYSLIGATVLEQLEELTLPPLTDSEVARLLLRSPQIRTVPRVRLPFFSAAFDEVESKRYLPQLERGVYFPHRSSRTIHGREVMCVRRDEDLYHWLSYGRIMALVERCYAHLPAPVRDQLDDLLDAFEDLAYHASEGKEAFDASLESFVAIFHAITTREAPGRRIAALLEELDSASDRTSPLRIEKVWGW